MNKKIILSILTLGMLAVVASAGTWAYFQDTQSTGVNKVTAGKISLSLDGADSDTWPTPIVLNEVILYPGLTQTDDFPGLGIFNTGNVPGVLSCTCINSDGNDLAQFMTVKVDGATVFNGASTGDQVLKTNFIPNWDILHPLDFSHAYKPQIVYTFNDNNNDQTATAQGKTFKFTLKFTLKTPPQ
jgi:predicted ribosomally synthesized peptide with SipW-like signal peptide